MNTMIRRTALVSLAAALLFVAPVAHAQQTPVPIVLDGEARAAALREANQMLNAVQRMAGRFTQTGPDGGRATGAFFIERPGKLRFQYDPPATLLIVSNGRTVFMRDSELRTTDQVALRSTPLDLILRNNISLQRQARVLRVSESGPWLMVTIRDRYGETDGQLTLHFSRPDGLLRSWDILDATGARTRTTLSDTTAPESLDPGLFRLE